MKKVPLYIFSFLSFLLIFSSVSPLLTPSYALTCQDVTQACGTGTGNCCQTSSNGKPLWCKPSQRGGAGTCTEQIVGVTCKAEGDTCQQVAGAGGCCTVNANGKALTCDTTTNKCIVAQANKKTCIAQYQKCTPTDICCSTGGQNVSCVDNSGKPLFIGLGTCLPAANTNAGANATPPPPPCADNMKLPSGGADQTGCKSVDTAFGIWSTEPQGFIKNLFSILLSFSGALAMLMIIIAGYRLVTSQGDPEKIQGAREQINSAIIGLLFLIFSLVILEIIGVNILHLPCWATGTTVSSNCPK